MRPDTRHRFIEVALLRLVARCRAMARHAVGGIVAAGVAGLLAVAPIGAAGATQGTAAADAPPAATGTMGDGTPAAPLAKLTLSDISLEGAADYSIDTDNSVVELGAERIANRRAAAASALIRLELWAFRSPYTGGRLDGVQLAKISLGTLQAGFSFEGVRVPAVLQARPPAGVWQIALLVTELAGSASNDGFVARDWRNFPTPWFIGDIVMEGAASWSAAPGVVRVQLDRISNQRSRGVSGPLRLELWASADPLTDGRAQGYRMTKIELDPLPAGSSFARVDRTGQRDASVPSGTWFVTLVLSEYTGAPRNEGYSVLAYQQFASPLIVPGPVGPTVRVVEFTNLATGRYFRTAEAAEVAAIAAGAAGPGWVRTFDDFTAFAPGSASPGSDVCRFYTRGANSHFYTAAAGECAALRQPGTGWLYEGLAFRIQLPTIGECAPWLRPVFRLYNDRFAQGESNHRFTTLLDEARRLSSAARPWTYEGVAFCALAE